MWLPGEESSYTESQRARARQEHSRWTGGTARRPELKERELWAGWSESQLRTGLCGFLKRPCLFLMSKNPLEGFKC